MFNNEPKTISVRNVANDLICSEWQDLGMLDNPTMEQFLKFIEDNGLSPLMLSMRAYHNKGEGLVLDYGLRKQFWIPNVDGWDLNYFKNPIEERIKKITLKPCPFCGSEAKLHVAQELVSYGDEGFFIQCSNDECLMNTVTVNGGYSQYPEDIINRWNRRTK